jgi:hypothetical protein
VSGPTEYTLVDFGSWTFDAMLERKNLGFEVPIGFDIKPSERRTGPKRNAARRAAAIARIARRKAKRRSAR